MSKKLKDEEFFELYKAVQKINDQVLAKYEWPQYDQANIVSLDCVPPSTFCSVVGYTAIKVNVGQHSIEIWSSIDEDELRIKYDNGEYESWYKFIRRRWKEVRESFFNEKL